MAGLKMNVEFPTRLCEVKGELGYFHLWERWSNVIDASPLRGGHPAGQIGQVYGIETKDKKYWWQMIQLLPSSYNQRRTVMLNYEVLANIYKSRRNHKLDEWHTFCDWIEGLPYSALITGTAV